MRSAIERRWPTVEAPQARRRTHGRPTAGAPREWTWVHRFAAPAPSGLTKTLDTGRARVVDEARFVRVSVDFRRRLRSVPPVRCRRCHGPCLSPAQIAEQLRRLREDARRNAAELEPVEDGSPRMVAERDYIDIAHEQLASELEGICTACWFAGAEPDKRWVN